METFFWSLLIAAIIALTYVAYKRPVAFKDYIAYPLLGFVILVLVGITCHNLGGIHFVINDLAVKVQEMEGGKEIIENLVKPLKNIYDVQIYTLIIGGSVIVYLILLINLPKLLSLNDKEKKDT